MEQHEKDELIRSEEKVKLEQVLKIIKGNFNDMHNQMKGRTSADQMIIGGTLTSLELEIKKEIKLLTTFK